MARSYRHIQQYEEEISELTREGLTQREIAEKSVFTKEQVKGFIERKHKEERRSAA